MSSTRDTEVGHFFLLKFLFLFFCMWQRWEPDAMKDRYAPSAVEILRMVDESLDAYFALPVSQFPDLLQELVNRLDVVLENYANQTIAPCGTCSLNIISVIVIPLLSCLFIFCHFLVFVSFIITNNFCLSLHTSCFAGFTFMFRFF